MELDNVVYRFTGELLRRSAAERLLGNLKTRVAKAQTRPDEIGLSFEFPTEVRFGKPPETLLWVRLGGAGAEIETVHSYPSEDAVVWTRSSAVRTVGCTTRRVPRSKKCGSLLKSWVSFRGPA